MSGSATRAKLCGNKVLVEAEMADGRLRERYLDRMANDSWSEVTTSDQPVCLFGGQTSFEGNSIFCLPRKIEVTATKLLASADKMTQVFEAEFDGLRIVRTISFDENDSWLRVVTRLEPTRPVELQSLGIARPRLCFGAWLHAPNTRWPLMESTSGFTSVPILRRESRFH